MGWNKSGNPARQREEIRERIEAVEEDVADLQRGARPDMTDQAAELINDHHLDPQAIMGTGEDGRILKGDVETYLEAVQEEDESGGDSEE